MVISMTSFLKKPYCYGTMLFALLVGILTGCAQIIQIPATPTSTAILFPTQTPTIYVPSSMPSPTPNVNVKQGDLPPGCGKFLNTLSPDLMWAVNNCGPNGDVVVWKIGEQQTTTLSPPTNSKEYGVDYCAAFSPDGKKLLIAVPDGPLLLFDVGQWQTSGTLYPKILPISFSWSPGSQCFSWSPDSQSFTISYLVPGQALSVMNLDGTYKNLIAFDEVHTGTMPSGATKYALGMFGPTWSPDGRKIAYVIAKDMVDPPPIQLWTVEVASGKKELLYSGKVGEVGYEPEWSPDGTKILVVNDISDYNHNAMYIYDVKQKTFNLLLKLQFPNHTLWSPDSQRIAFCNNVGGQYLISVGTGETSLVSSYCGILQWQDNHSMVMLNENSLSLLTVP